MTTLFDAKFAVNNLYIHLRLSVAIEVVGDQAIIKGDMDDKFIKNLADMTSVDWFNKLCIKVSTMGEDEQSKLLNELGEWLSESGDEKYATHPVFLEFIGVEKTFVNLTPHAIVMNDGTVFEPSGSVARVSVSYASPEGIFTRQVFGEVENLPEPKPGTYYIVSGMVLSACSDRGDVVAPATGHPDVVRNEKGHIVSVPYLTFG